MRTRLEILDKKLRGKLRLYALLAPHLKGTGKGNSACCCGTDGRKLFNAQREDIDMSFGCAPDFTRRSVGYVGFSDGWKDLMDNFKMDWEFEKAVDGNIALTGEIDLSDGMEFTLSVGFGETPHSASAHLLQAFATPFADQRAKYISQWQRLRWDGEGRCWPILTGERAHYEHAAGRDPLPFNAAMEKFANEGGMLPEQLWDADNLRDRSMKRGGPTGSAMPLCWAHAEYVTLVRSHKDGVCFDRIEPVYQRYAKAATGSTVEMWTVVHQLKHIAKGKTLRIITDKAARIHWSFDGWATANDSETHDTGIGCWFADLPSDKLPARASIVFTFLWPERWEGKDFRVAIADSLPTRKTP